MRVVRMSKQQQNLKKIEAMEKAKQHMQQRLNQIKGQMNVNVDSSIAPGDNLEAFGIHQSRLCGHRFCFSYLSFCESYLELLVEN